MEQIIPAQICKRTLWDAMLIGFSAGKPKFSLDDTTADHENKKLLNELGKYEMGKACIYCKNLADLNRSISDKLSKATIKY